MNVLDWLRNKGADLVIGPRPTVIAPVDPLTIAPPPRFAWDEKRWERVVGPRATQYFGQYRILHRASGTWRTFDGRIVERPADIRTFIANPPGEIKSHPKAPCFTLADAPWFQVHWRYPPRNVDDAVLYVERVVAEAVNQGGQA